MRVRPASPAGAMAFPSLSLTDAAGRAVEPNSAEPFAIESPHFRGRGLFLLRTRDAPDGDPYQAAVFRGRQRIVEVQLQGRFVAPGPPGPVFFGAEITDVMRLGLLGRSFAKAILAFVGQIAPGLHWSFGDRGDAAPPGGGERDRDGNGGGDGDGDGGDGEAARRRRAQQQQLAHICGPLLVAMPQVRRERSLSAENVPSL